MFDCEIGLYANHDKANILYARIKIPAKGLEKMHKTLFVAVTTLMLASVALGQSTTTTAAGPTTAPARARWNPQDHFHTRVAQIRDDISKLPSGTTGTIVMLGDSLTEQFFRQKQMPDEINGLIVMNQGISGDQIDRPTSGTGVTHRIELVADAKPAVVFVLIGANDFWGGREQPAEVIPQYTEMFRMLKTAAPNAKFVWQSLLPTSRDKSHLNSKIDELNPHIARLALEAGDVYVDLHPYLEDGDGELRAEFTNDGVHLTPAAYQVWLKIIREQVAGLGL